MSIKKYQKSESELLQLLDAHPEYDEKLPSVYVLSDLLKTSRTTVSRALIALEKRDIITKTPTGKYKKKIINPNQYHHVIFVSRSHPFENSIDYYHISRIYESILKYIPLTICVSIEHSSFDPQREKLILEKVLIAKPSALIAYPVFENEKWSNKDLYEKIYKLSIPILFLHLDLKFPFGSSIGLRYASLLIAQANFLKSFYNCNGGLTAIINLNHKNRLGDPELRPSDLETIQINFNETVTGLYRGNEARTNMEAWVQINGDLFDNLFQNQRGKVGIIAQEDSYVYLIYLALNKRGYKNYKIISNGNTSTKVKTRLKTLGFDVPDDLFDYPEINCFYSEVGEKAVSLLNEMLLNPKAPSTTILFDAQYT